MKHSRIRRILRLPPPKLWLRLEAATWLSLARVALSVVPFRRLAAYVGPLQSPSVDSSVAPAWAAETAREVSLAVNATALNAPVAMVCLPRALAAWQMLHRRGVSSRLHFGKSLGKGTERQMHAWLSSAGVEVTGFPVAHDCVEIGYFARAEQNTAR